QTLEFLKKSITASCLSKHRSALRYRTCITFFAYREQSCRYFPVADGHRLKLLGVDDFGATQRIRVAVRSRLRGDNDLYCLACMERKIFESKSSVLLDGRFNPRF